MTFHNFKVKEYFKIVTTSYIEQAVLFHIHPFHFDSNTMSSTMPNDTDEVQTIEGI